MKKVIEKLNFILKLVESNLSNTKIIELVYKECVDTIKEVEELQDKNCSNCKFVGLTGYGNLKCENISSVICNKMTDYKISCTEWELNNEKI